MMFTAFESFSIIIYQNVSVTSATIIRVSHKNTNSIQTAAQNVKFTDITVNILSVSCSHTMSKFVIIKTDKTGCVYVVS